jgi:hypothetical protein
MTETYERGSDRCSSWGTSTHLLFRIGGNKTSGGEWDIEQGSRRMPTRSGPVETYPFSLN